MCMKKIGIKKKSVLNKNFNDTLSILSMNQNSYFVFESNKL